MEPVSLDDVAHHEGLGTGIGGIHTSVFHFYSWSDPLGGSVKGRPPAGCHMEIAVAQWRPTPGEPPANRDRAAEAIAEAADRGGELVVLPELFTVGYFAFDAWAEGAEPFHGSTLEMAAEAARTHDIAVLAGSFVEDLAQSESVPVPAEEGLANTSVLLDSDGTVVTWYRKSHLFGYGSDEPALMVPGETLGVGSLGAHTIGLATCYDLRFPELLRQYVDAGVTLLLVPSAWPSARGEHWTLLCRVRAMENQLFLAAANGCGTIGDTTLLGTSCITDPWGEIVAELDDEPGIALANAPRETVERIRDEFPLLADRRPDLSRS